MSSNTKVADLSNIRELLKIYTEVLNELSVIELRDPVTKQLYKIAPFLKMSSMYVPRAKEIQDGTLTHWKIDHLLTTSDYFVEQGFQEGKLPDHKEFCDYRLADCQVFTNAFGEIQDPDHHTVIAWYEYVTTFPAKLYNEMNKHVAAELRKRIIPCEIKHDEPFGALIAFQRVTFRLIKQAIAAQDQIAKALRELEQLQIHTRNDIINMEAEANILLTLKEIGMLKPKFHCSTSTASFSLLSWALSNASRLTVQPPSISVLPRCVLSWGQ